jgi:dipeptidyl aminopeptidase/acylaminoacyl peptidase
MVGLRLLIVCAAACAAVTLPTAVALAAFPGANGRISYKLSWMDDRRTFREGYWSSRSDGTRVRPIVRHATSVNLSADGRRAVFTRAGGIGFVRSTGTGRSWLMGHAPRPSDPDWGAQWAALSPDGTQVAFTANGPNSYVMGVDGTNRYLIAEEAVQPIFSPDGTRIAYIKELALGEAENHGRAIETIAADGTNRRRLIEYSKPSVLYATTVPLRIDFAPDGRKLLVVEYSCCDQNIGRIAIINARTGDRRRLPSRVTGSVSDAVWSPDGRWIGYTVRSTDAYGSVFTIRPNGTGKRVAFTVRLPSKWAWRDSLDWQPRP